MDDTGTLWLNLGDSYWANRAGNGESGGEGGTSFSGRVNQTRAGGRPRADIKPKDLIGIPWMVAFALRADGWYLRSEIIWHKPNPMPESVTDRPTKSHEQLFLLSKSTRYYYDAEAILEPVTGTTHARVSQKVQEQIGSFRANGGSKTNGPMKAVVRTPKQQPAGSGIKNNDSFNNALVMPVLARNKRSVWTVASKPYSGAHFATFPPALIEPCILAGSRVGDTVLDPFGGSGTTASVAVRHGRKAILCELNPDYITLINKRLDKTQIELTAAVQP
jgi:site-specific DNA-methyltransferase (cytosine-N4-specific)